MNHAHLPAVNNAQLPETYERAKTALAECSSLDECKDWSDKAQALASYARQADDESMRKMADRIRARAIRRCGELLKQVESATGRNLPNVSKGSGPSRSEAAREAGMSERQQKTAANLANIDGEEFTELVESDNPPTVTKLAEIGKKRQLVDLGGRDPKEFNKALHFVALFERHLKNSREYDIEKTAAILTDSERKKLRSIIGEIDLIHDKVITRI